MIDVFFPKEKLKDANMDKLVEERKNKSCKLFNVTQYTMK